MPTPISQAAEIVVAGLSYANRYVQGTVENIQKERAKYWALLRWIGNFTHWITHTSDDVSTQGIASLAGWKKIASDSAPSNGPQPNFVPSMGVDDLYAPEECKNLVLQDPAACALHHILMIQIFRQLVVGWDDAKCGPSETGGLFGAPLGFAFATEDQQRLALHIHTLLITKGFARTTAELIRNRNLHPGGPAAYDAELANLADAMRTDTPADDYAQQGDAIITTDSLVETLPDLGDLDAVNDSTDDLDTHDDFCTYCNDAQGRLMCCEGCPRVSHLECTPLCDEPELYYCESCTTDLDGFIESDETPPSMALPVPTKSGKQPMKKTYFALNPDLHSTKISAPCRLENIRMFSAQQLPKSLDNGGPAEQPTQVEVADCPDHSPGSGEDDSICFPQGIAPTPMDVSPEQANMPPSTGHQHIDSDHYDANSDDEDFIANDLHQSTGDIMTAPSMSRPCGLTADMTALNKLDVSNCFEHCSKSRSGNCGPFNITELAKEYTTMTKVDTSLPKPENATCVSCNTTLNYMDVLHAWALQRLSTDARSAFDAGNTRLEGVHIDSSAALPLPTDRRLSVAQQRLRREGIAALTIIAIRYLQHDYRHRRGCFKSSKGKRHSSCRFNLPGALHEQALVSVVFSPDGELSFSLDDVTAISVSCKRILGNELTAEHSRYMLYCFGTNTHFRLLNGSPSLVYYCTTYASKCPEGKLGAGALLCETLGKVDQRAPDGATAAPGPARFRALLNASTGHSLELGITVCAHLLLSDMSTFEYSHDFTNVLTTQSIAYVNGEDIYASIVPTDFINANDLDSDSDEDTSSTATNTIPDSQQPDLYAPSAYIMAYDFRQPTAGFIGMCLFEFAQRYTIKKGKSTKQSQHQLLPGHPLSNSHQLQRSNNPRCPNLLGKRIANRSCFVSADDAATLESYCAYALTMYKPFGAHLPRASTTGSSTTLSTAMINAVALHHTIRQPGQTWFQAYEQYVGMSEVAAHHSLQIYSCEHIECAATPTTCSHVQFYTYLRREQNYYHNSRIARLMRASGPSTTLDAHDDSAAVADDDFHTGLTADDIAAASSAAELADATSGVLPPGLSASPSVVNGLQYIQGQLSASTHSLQGLQQATDVTAANNLSLITCRNIPMPATSKTWASPMQASTASSDVSTSDTAQSMLVLGAITDLGPRHLSRATTVDAPFTPNISVAAAARASGLLQDADQFRAFQILAVVLLRGFLKSQPTTSLDPAITSARVAVASIVDPHTTDDPLWTNRVQLMISGQGGSGKSTVISAIKRFATSWGISDRLVVTSTTASSALLIGGQTIHGWCGCKLATGFPQKKTRHDAFTAADIDLLLIDEVSFLNATSLGSIERHTAHIKIGKTPETNLFGGISVAFFGDLIQLQPVGYSMPFFDVNKTFYNYTKATSALQKIGLSVWASMTHVVFLSTNYRAKADPKYADFLTEYRKTHKVTNDHLRTLNSRRVTPTLNVPLNATWAFTKNEDAVTTNMCLVHQAATAASQQVFRLTAEIRKSASSQKLPPGPPLRSPLVGSGSSKVNPKSTALMPHLDLYYGCAVYIQTDDNKKCNVGIANNSKGYFFGTVPSLQSLTSVNQLVRLPNGCNATVTTLTRLPDYILLKIPTFTGSYEGLPQGVLPLPPKRINMNVHGYSMKKHVSQFPLRHTHALTVHKLQGSECINGIVAGNLTKAHLNHIYVLLSRVRSWNSLYILPHLRISRATLSFTLTLTDRGRAERHRQLHLANASLISLANSTKQAHTARLITLHSASV